MKRIALIFSFNESNWVSCQKIVYNLHQSYQACQDTEIKKFNLPHENTPQFQLEELIKGIKEYAPDIISIIDHKPHPLHFLTRLSKEYSESIKPELYIHIFGDFSLYFSQWANLESILAQFPVKFFVASDRQKVLIDRFLKGSEAILCPFPVDKSEFDFNHDLRKQQRRIWGVDDNDKIFIYTGRLSRQKRIKSMIRLFAHVFKTQPRAKLYIYGHQDMVGDPFLGIYELPGEYFRIFNRFYKSLPLDVQKRIVFKKQVSSSELQKVYQGADCLLNLSVHNDEDFGMSVAEAHSTGLQSVLSSWGGLRSFSYGEDPEFSLFCKTRIGIKSKLISTKDFTTHLLHTFNQTPTDDQRSKRAKLSQSRFSIESISKILHHQLQTPAHPFTEFSSLLHDCSAKQLSANFEPMFLTTSRQINKLYKRVYSAYADETN